MFDLNAYALANRAGCGCPDSLESPGARWLQQVADAAQELYERGEDEDTRNDDVFKVADQCVPIYTHEVWSVFVDVQGYLEDVSDYSPDLSEGMEKAAQIALLMIAERLVTVLLEEAEAEAADQDEDEDDEDNSVNDGIGGEA